MPNNMMVSIICNAYNHEKYIRDALEGFVVQKTSFPFEILVHDDASTDNTAAIIKEYERKFPNLIKPIYQKENQYSKSFEIINEIQFGRAQGKYIAICEGDDYWIDPYKLQKQVDALEKHPETDMCAHSHLEVFADTGKFSKKSIRSSQTTIFSPEQIIFGGGDFLGTASLIFRKELYDNFLPFAKENPFDYTLQISGSLRGGILYLPDVMSVYRLLVPGSWTVNNLKNYKENIIKLVCVLEQLNIDTNCKYNDIIRFTIMLLDSSRNTKFLERFKSYITFREYVKLTGTKGYIKAIVKVFFPKLITLRNHIKNN